MRFHCRGLFATHYHKLADAHADDPATSIRHMACYVAEDEAGREQVTAQHFCMYLSHDLLAYALAQYACKCLIVIRKSRCMGSAVDVQHEVP